MKSFTSLTMLIKSAVTGVVLLACEGSVIEKTSIYDSENTRAPFMTYEILPYEITDEHTVTLIKTDVKNIYKDSAFILIVKAYKNDQVFMDSLSFAVRKGDSISANIVFTQLEYEINKPPKVEFIFK